jgi:hypothetical protein
MSVAPKTTRVEFDQRVANEESTNPFATATPAALKRVVQGDALLRWAPIAGIVFVVLMLVGSRLVGDVPAPDATQQQIAAYLSDSANHTRNIVGAYLWVFGALVFLVFLVRLRNDLRRAEGGTGVLSGLAFGAGVAFSAVWMVSAVTFVAVANSIALRHAHVTSTDLVRVLPPMGRLLLLLGGGFSGLVVLLATAAVIMKTDVYPRWLAWLGIAGAVTLLFDVTYLSIFPFWGWVLVASIVMLTRRRQAAPLTEVATP